MRISTRKNQVMIDTLLLQNATGLTEAKPIANLILEMILILSGSLLIALSAQFYLPLPFSPVPITGQTFSVLLLSSLYGHKRGVLTVITYLCLGLAGNQVFANGASGIGVITGATGGYLLGFIPASYVVGLLSHKGWDRRIWSTAGAMIIGNGIIYVFGLLWLSQFKNILGSQTVLQAGLFPFLIGDLAKLILATVLLPTGWKLINRHKS